MKKIFPVITSFLCMTGRPVAQTVTVMPLTVDYATRTVIFRVEWSGTTTPAGKVWIDFCRVNGTAPGAFSPAGTTKVAAAADGGSVDEASLNGRGFFVTASPTAVYVTPGVRCRECWTGWLVSNRWCGCRPDVV
ncbi:MAG: hypothetical protein LBI89_01090 [Prevotellaceae bacterium]|nr:hypothetical protein [Prevotellaceae bacterium]